MSRSSGGGVMSTVRALLALALIVVLAIFAYQNAAPVELKFLDWAMESRRFVVIGGSFVIGMLVGMLVKSG